MVKGPKARPPRKGTRIEGRQYLHDWLLAAARKALADSAVAGETVLGPDSDAVIMQRIAVVFFAAAAFDAVLNEVIDGAFLGGPARTTIDPDGEWPATRRLFLEQARWQPKVELALFLRTPGRQWRLDPKSDLIKAVTGLMSLRNDLIHGNVHPEVRGPSLDEAAFSVSTSPSRPRMNARRTELPQELRAALTTAELEPKVSAVDALARRFRSLIDPDLDAGPGRVQVVVGDHGSAPWMQSTDGNRWQQVRWCDARGRYVFQSFLITNYARDLHPEDAAADESTRECGEEGRKCKLRRSCAHQAIRLRHGGRP